MDVLSSRGGVSRSRVTPRALSSAHVRECFRSRISTSALGWIPADPRGTDAVFPNWPVRVSVNRDALRPALLALVAVAAIVVGAATLDSAQVVQSEGSVGTGGTSGVGASQEGDGLDTGEDDGGLVRVFENRGQFGIQPPCVRPLRRPPAVAGLLGAFLFVGLAIRRQTDTIVAATVLLTFAIPVGLVYALLTACRSQPLDTRGAPVLNNASSGGGASGFGLTGDVTVVPTTVPPVVLVFVGLVVVGALALALSGRSGLSSVLSPVTPDRGAPEGSDDPRPGATAAAVGRAAGRAADRIETGTDVENEVYRAWREMTDHLEVDRPESSTPGEFAAAAVDAGMIREDVTELTRLFEEVRYGGYEADEDRERRAVEALRELEREYTDAGAGSTVLSDGENGDENTDGGFSR